MTAVHPTLAPSRNRPFIRRRTWPESFVSASTFGRYVSIGIGRAQISLALRPRDGWHTPCEGAGFEVPGQPCWKTNSRPKFSRR